MASSACAHVLLAPQVMHPLLTMGCHPLPMGLNPNLSIHPLLSMGLLHRVQPLTCLHLALVLDRLILLWALLHNMQRLLAIDLVTCHIVLRVLLCGSVTSCGL